MNLKGGLGNQMFQYALGRNLSLKNNTELKLNISSFKKDKLFRIYSLSIFNISATTIFNPKLISRNIITQILSKVSKKNYISLKQKNRYFKKDILTKKGNIFLDGHWMSEEYFKNIRKMLLNDFKIKEKLHKKNTILLKKINSTNSIAIHVRRTDYINNPVTKSILCTCSQEYYNNAIKYLKKKIKNPKFFIFSDDINWCKKNLKLPLNSVFVDINPLEKGYLDLELMKNCKQFIIANSSFSWWGAWLSENKNKIICAPKKWFVNQNEGDIVPKSWIRI